MTETLICEAWVKVIVKVFASVSSTGTTSFLYFPSLSRTITWNKRKLEFKLCAIVCTRAEALDWYVNLKLFTEVLTELSPAILAELSASEFDSTSNIKDSKSS